MCRLTSLCLMVALSCLATRSTAFTLNTAARIAHKGSLLPHATARLRARQRPALISPAGAYAGASRWSSHHRGAVGVRGLAAVASPVEQGAAAMEEMLRPRNGVDQRYLFFGGKGGVGKTRSVTYLGIIRWSRETASYRLVLEDMLHVSTLERHSSSSHRQQQYRYCVCQEGTIAVAPM